MKKTATVTWLVYVLALILVSTLGVSAQADLMTGLQSYWDFNGNGNDGQGSVDVVANNVGSTISYSSAGVSGQAVLVPHNAGAGASFMGTVGPAGSNYNTTGKYVTVSFWYKQTKAIGAGGSMYHLAQPGYPDLGIYTTDGTGKGYALIGTGRGSMIAAGFESADIWQHRVLRFNRYATGAVHQVEQWYATAAEADHGGYDAYGDHWIDCVIDPAAQLFIAKNGSTDNDIMYDEVAIWNRALSDAEIETLFDMGKAGTAIIPEPATMTLLLVGLCGTIIRKRR